MDFNKLWKRVEPELKKEKSFDTQFPAWKDFLRFVDEENIDTVNENVTDRYYEWTRRSENGKGTYYRCLKQIWEKAYEIKAVSSQPWKKNYQTITSNTIMTDKHFKQIYDVSSEREQVALLLFRDGFTPTLLPEIELIKIVDKYGVYKIKLPGDKDYKIINREIGVRLVSYLRTTKHGRFEDSVHNNKKEKIGITTIPGIILKKARKINPEYNIPSIRRNGKNWTKDKT
jgi:hypothetical protein